MAYVGRGGGAARRLLATAFVLGLAAATVAAAMSASDAAPNNAGVAQAKAHSHPQYSPFVVHVSHRDVPFDVISFKDVGMSVPQADRQRVYESIAQSLSYELGSHAELPMSSEVRYSEAIADPANHTYCEGRHIYVDMWHAASSPQWGYSLWSGCGENDQFAWKELPAGSEGNTFAGIEPLTRDIARSLREAVQTGCFTKAC